MTLPEACFDVQVAQERLRGDMLGSPASLRALFLHGAGQSHRQRQRLLREDLAQRGFGSAAFDFSGHGDSSANQPSSLQTRLLQAQHVWQHLAAAQLDTLVGTSMSGEIAIRLACNAHTHIRHLVLIVGAIYDREAFTLPFGPAFSAAIRRPHSWRAAQTLELLATYCGGLTLVRALDDTVIPHEVADLLAQAARHARFVRRIDLVGVDHRISDTMAQDASLRRCIAAAIADSAMDEGELKRLS